eukprot:gene25404-biopygen11994
MDNAAPQAPPERKIYKSAGKWEMLRARSIPFQPTVPYRSVDSGLSTGAEGQQSAVESAPEVSAGAPRATPPLPPPPRPHPRRSRSLRPSRRTPPCPPQRL